MEKCMTDNLTYFVQESNRIEGINRKPLPQELNAHHQFLAHRWPTVADLVTFVQAIQPDAQLRDQVGLNVRVGNHYPPPGGPQIVEALETLLQNITSLSIKPFPAHCLYETLHPFTDGNGRSGRVLWLWHCERMGMASAHRMGFLHLWYYQSLESVRT